MNSAPILAVAVLGTLAMLAAYASPAYAQQSTMTLTNAVPAVDSVINTGSSIPVQLVRRGGGGRAFHAGRVGRFHHYRPAYFLGGYYAYFGNNYYAGCGEGCYQEGDKTCVWNGYKYRCYVTSDESY